MSDPIGTTPAPVSTTVGATTEPSTDVRWGLMLEDMVSFEAIDRWTRHCDELEVDAISVPEGPTIFEDPIAKLSLLARASTSQLLGTIVTAPGLRHPAVL